MKNPDWAIEDELHWTAKAWVDKPNAANAERMRQESAQQFGPIEEDLGSPNPVWPTLVGCEVTLTIKFPH